jgi:hypothetical protein
VPDLPWFVFALLLLPLGLILFATVYKSLEVRAARQWPSTAGKVVISNSEVREVRVIEEHGHRFEPRNFANIVYEYSVGGQTLRNNRVSIGEDRGNFEVAETIARYPAGTAVTVYYNPRHPREAVLERDPPKGLWGCLGIGTAIALAVVFGSAVGLNQLNQFISARLADLKLSPLVVAFCAFGFVLALFALALQRQASLARRWPVVPGTIQITFARSEVMYRRRVSYTYRFNNVAYSNVEASLATGLNSASGWLARKFAAAYPAGASTNVYVNPANPSESTLNPRAGWLCWFLWLVAFAFGAVAYFVAHIG